MRQRLARNSVEKLSSRKLLTSLEEIKTPKKIDGEELGLWISSLGIRKVQNHFNVLLVPSSVTSDDVSLSQTLECELASLTLSCSLFVHNKTKLDFASVTASKKTGEEQRLQPFYSSNLYRAI